jgi:hypothetical protein
MSEEVISIDSIKTNRELDPKDSILDLANDIQELGLKVPILIDPDHILVDGLRRLKALQLFGRVSVLTTVAETYEEAMVNLKLANQGRGPVGPKRTWEIEVALANLLMERTARLRARYARVPMDKRGTVEKLPRSRELFTDAMNDLNASKYGQIYRAAEAGSESAEELIKLMESGKINVSGAIGRLDAREKGHGTGDVVHMSEQRVLLQSAVRSLSALVKGLQKLGSPIRLPRSELRALADELKINRRQLVGMIRHIEKESRR